MKTKIIAEMCYNWNGEISLAKKMIDEAKALNLWAVKFQKWDIDNFPEEIKNQKRNDKHSFGSTYYEHRKALEPSVECLLELKEYTEYNDMLFFCSAKDYNSLLLLLENGISNIKLPSQRLFDKQMLIYIKSNRNKIRQLAVSTGMHYEEELREAEILGYSDIVMHCITDYPAKLNDCDIGYMRQSRLYNGYSSHETEGRAIKYAVACGARYVERHYTLDKSMKGADHIVSSDYEEMKRIVNEIKETEMILGSGKRDMNKPELKNREYYLKF